MKLEGLDLQVLHIWKVFKKKQPCIGKVYNNKYIKALHLSYSLPISLLLFQCREKVC